MIKPIQKWLDNHKNPTSFWLHMIGVPACFVVAPALLILSLTNDRDYSLAALYMFVGGYAIQFIGHFIEGNRSGEEKLIRRLLKIEDDQPAKVKNKRKRK